jgi:hypothetical protein
MSGLESVDSPLSPVYPVPLISINHDFLSREKKPLFDLNVFMDAEIHLLIHFLWLRGAFNEQIMCQIKETSGDGVIHVQGVQQCTHDFVAERTEFDALSRLDRPIDPENTDRIRELLESKPHISQKTLSRRLNLHHDTVHRILTEKLGLYKFSFKWIPHFLRESQKQEHVRISMELFRFQEESSPQKVAKVFPCNES